MSDMSLPCHYHVITSGHSKSGQAITVPDGPGALRVPLPMTPADGKRRFLGLLRQGPCGKAQRQTGTVLQHPCVEDAEDAEHQCHVDGK